MKNNNYQIRISVNADAKKAFENICNVAGWWTKNIEGSSEKLNDVFTVPFGETFVKFKIIELIPNKKIVWAVTDSYLPFVNDKKEWNNTRVDWEIAGDNDTTKITMTHEGLMPAVECYENCEKGWNFYTGESLKKLINEGKGMPDTPTNKRTQVP
jgi:hypothetical protein